MTTPAAAHALVTSSEEFRRRVRWILGVVRRGKFIIAGCLLLACVPTILYLYHAKRLYTAQAEVLIEAPDVGDNLLERSYGRSRLTEASIQTEVDILSSASLAAKAIDKLHLDQDPEFNASLRQPETWQKLLDVVNPLPLLTGQSQGEAELSGAGRAAIAKTAVQATLLGKLDVKARRRSFVISVQFTAQSGEKAARIANALADLYVLDRLEASFLESRKVNEWLSERLEALRQDVAVAERATEQYRISHNLAMRRKGERQNTIADQQLTELNSRLVLARADLAQRQARLDQVRTLSRTNGAVETSFDVLQSSLIQRLREQESVRQRELSEAMKTYGERHPRIIGFRADLDELRSKIAQEVAKVAAALANEVETARVGTATLEREIGGLKQDVDASGRDEIGLRELERQAEASRALYENFLGRFKRDSEQERIQRANARVLSPAAIPVRPSAPRRLRLLGLAALFGSLAGLGLVFLLDRLNSRVRSAEEGEELTGLPLLSIIPWWRSDNSMAAGNDARPPIVDPRSALADAFRSLRAVLTTVAGQRGDKIVLITSSVPQEGKSFIARNLAAICAATGQKVLIVDADLMRPRQHVLMGEEMADGLTQLLADAALVPQSLILRDHTANLDVLPAGSVDASSGHALASQRVEEVFAALVGFYDRIIIDAPPCLAATDAQNLARIAQQVIYVVKWNATPREAVLTGLSHLRKVGASVAGLVLSQVKSSLDSADSYGGYGYYGGYNKYYRQNKS